MIRMLIVSYCFGIRSERRLCDEVHLTLACRWFFRLGAVPDHSTFSTNRHGRFRDRDLLPQLFEATVKRCMAEGLVGGDGFAVDASLIRAEAAACQPTCGAAPWLGHERGIERHVPVFDKSHRQDGTFSHADLVYDREHDLYRRPSGSPLTTSGTLVNDGATLHYRASKVDCDACALKPGCSPTEPARKLPRSIHEGARGMARRLTEEDEWLASRRERKKVKMLFCAPQAHSEARPITITRPLRRSRRVPPRTAA
jgi:hypothetical protein